MRLAPVLVVLGAAVLMVVLRVLVVSSSGHVEHRASEDMNAVKNIVQLLGNVASVDGKLPMKAGKLDPYALVILRHLDERSFDAFRSTRYGGPTDEEIRNGRVLGVPVCALPRPGSAGRRRASPVG